MNPIIATSSGSTNFEPCPAGNHVARCYSMVHIGTIEDSYMGETHTVNKVRLTFEFPTERRIFNEEKGEQPYALSKEFTLSMHEKSNLRKMLEGWRGKAFTEAEAKSFDITKLLGVPCMVNVVHREKPDGKVYANIASISAVPKGLTCPDQINKSVVFTVNYFDWDVFDSFPDFLKDKIRASKEYADLKKSEKKQSEQVFPGEQPVEPPENLFANDLPF